MNKSVKYLVKKQFPNNAEQMLEIMQETSNPEVALEILLGIYEEPEGFSKEPSKEFLKDSKSRNRHDIEFIKFNKFNEEVHYSYYEKEAYQVWLKEGDKIPTYQDVEDNKKDYLLGMWFEDAVAARGQRDLKKEDYRSLKVYGDLKKNQRVQVVDVSKWADIVMKR